MTQNAGVCSESPLFREAYDGRVSAAHGALYGRDLGLA